MATKKKNTAKTKTPAVDSKTVVPALPLFYSDPHALSVERHGTKGISSEANYSFARNTNSVPVTAMEFTRVMHDYPIVFSAADPVIPVAILGLRGANNLFVSDDNKWRDGVYIPAYVRRYPFILMESPDKLQYSLCIDESADHIVDGGQLLFENGEPSEMCKKALEFCSAYQGQHTFTLEFTAMLEKYSLLVDNRASIKLASGEELALTGFRVINEEKFMGLPDEVFLDWRQRGWLPLIYCHLLSTSNWKALADAAAAVPETGDES